MHCNWASFLIKKLLYIIRAEADFERVVCLAISGRKKFVQYFVFVGDTSPFFSDGIQNIFQKDLFSRFDFRVDDLCDYKFVSRLLKFISGGKLISTQQLKDRKTLIIKFVFILLLRKYIKTRKKQLVNKVIKRIAPDAILTDQSQTDPDYIPEIFRRIAIQKKIPVYIFTHGAAGGLHSFFSEQNFAQYEGCTVFCCSEYEDKSDAENRIILGDISSSYPYVHFMNKKNFAEIHFMENRKYKVGFMVGGIGPLTSTTGWHVMEEIIIDLSENEDVAMVLKLHPRMTLYDLRLIETFKNLLIVNRDTDRSRVTKWADIVVCSDHCSTIFEPMILGKKVVAIEGKHVPKYKDAHSPLKDSTVKHISSAVEFDLDNIPNADPVDPVTHTVAWGGNGSTDLAERFTNIIAGDKSK